MVWYRTHARIRCNIITTKKTRKSGTWCCAWSVCIWKCLIESHFADFCETHQMLLNYPRTTSKRNTVCDLRIISNIHVYSVSSVVLALCDTLCCSFSISPSFLFAAVSQSSKWNCAWLMRREKNSQRSWRGPLNSSKQLYPNSGNSVSTHPSRVLITKSSTRSNFWVWLCLWTWFSDESKVRHQQQELEQSWVQVRGAAAGREQAEHNLRLIQAQLAECRVSLEDVSRRLLHQQERGERSECAWVFTLA